jgi:hypothetical protein
MKTFLINFLIGSNFFFLGCIIGQSIERSKDVNGDWDKSHIADFPHGYYIVKDSEGREYYVIPDANAEIIPKYPLTIEQSQ